MSIDDIAKQVELGKVKDPTFESIYNSVFDAYMKKHSLDIAGETELKIIYKDAKRYYEKVTDGKGYD